MTISFTKFAAVLIIAVGGSTVQAGAAPLHRANTLQAPTPVLGMALLLPAVQAAREAARPAQSPSSNTLMGNGGPVGDTCTQSTPGNPEACDIDELTQRCDDAGGGMSSLPGGGVDCDTSHWD